MTAAKSTPQPMGPAFQDLAKLSRPALWILAARLKTLGLSVVPVLAGTWVAAQSGAWRVDVLFSAALAAAAIQIGTNLWNDAADASRGVDGPDRLGPPRMTSLGLLSAEHVRVAALLSFAVATLFGLYLAMLGGWPVVVIGLSSLAMGYLYSMGPYPLSGSPLGEGLVVAFFGVTAVAGTAYLNGAPVTLQSLCLGFVIGLPAAAVLLVNNHRDRVSDARSGRRTLAILLGVAGARRLYAGLLAASLLGALALGRPGPAGLLAFLPAAVLGALLIRALFRFPVSARLNRLIAGTSVFQILLLGAVVISGALSS
ncbi:1,4-dihydroxy-2-naphthoate octaprenyltransferase [Tropicimonas sp. IMCC34043]|uniref:1,4-dihydroxy-2-naphthoate octaprenyltransferase n=1 Tax=Tropicimonas sp. IMCC34043 TaxID=2248760 RepID=UPI000E242932|nr:1,4-dihydroxy-2-naphthoate octaprenyltransferase [Tropicimonas sp. IMCC34043]